MGIFQARPSSLRVTRRLWCFVLLELFRPLILLSVRYILMRLNPEINTRRYTEDGQNGTVLTDPWEPDTSSSALFPCEYELQRGITVPTGRLLKSFWGSTFLFRSYHTVSQRSVSTPRFHIRFLIKILCSFEVSNSMSGGTGNCFVHHPWVHGAQFENHCPRKAVTPPQVVQVTAWQNWFLSTCSSGVSSSIDTKFFKL
jgi:hypothetical protein